MYGKDGQSAESDQEPADAGDVADAAGAAGAGCGEARSAALPTFRPSPSPLPFASVRPSGPAPPAGSDAVSARAGLRYNRQTPLIPITYHA